MMSVFISKKMIALQSSAFQRVLSELQLPKKGQRYNPQQITAKLESVKRSLSTGVFTLVEVAQIKTGLLHLLDSLKTDVRSLRVYPPKSNPIIEYEIYEYGMRLNGVTELEAQKKVRVNLKEVTAIEALAKYRTLLRSPDLSVSDLTNMQSQFLFSHPVPTTTDSPLSVHFMTDSFKTSKEAFQAMIDESYESLVRQKGIASKEVTETVTSHEFDCRGQLDFLNNQLGYLKGTINTATGSHVLAPQAGTRQELARLETSSLIKEMGSQVATLQLLTVFAETTDQLNRCEILLSQEPPQTPAARKTSVSPVSSGFEEGLPVQLDRRALRDLAGKFQSYADAIDQAKDKRRLLATKQMGPVVMGPWKRSADDVLQRADSMRRRAGKENRDRTPRTPAQVATPSTEDIAQALFRSVHQLMVGTPLRRADSAIELGEPIPFQLPPTPAPSIPVLAEGSPSTPVNGRQHVPPASVSSWEKSKDSPEHEFRRQRELKAMALYFSTTCQLLEAAAKEPRLQPVKDKGVTVRQVEPSKRKELAELLSKVKGQYEDMKRKYSGGTDTLSPGSPRTPYGQVVGDLAEYMEQLVQGTLAKQGAQAPERKKGGHDAPSLATRRSPSTRDSGVKPTKLESEFEYEHAVHLEKVAVEEFKGLEIAVKEEATAEVAAQNQSMTVAIPAPVVASAPVEAKKGPEIHAGFVPSHGILKLDDPTKKRFVSGTFYDADLKVKAQGIFLVNRDANRITFTLIFGAEKGTSINRICVDAHKQKKYNSDKPLETRSVRNYLNGRVLSRDRLESKVETEGVIFKLTGKESSYSMPLEAFMNMYTPDPGAKRHFSLGITPPTKK